MSDVNDWNQAVIDEFRANAGKVGGPFAGFAEYQQKTTRIIPVITLTRTG